MTNITEALTDAGITPNSMPNTVDETDLFDADATLKLARINLRSRLTRFSQRALELSGEDVLFVDRMIEQCHIELARRRRARKNARKDTSG
ncbi:putative protein OS=Tsukamurella paurometabola (strain ATCC 8368 / DSM / CCUG 35730 /CIP 100753 / JCM 10117 / KCTC 9821 / NBRC 16120 / NCIMB 702349/ NCTC 13040) OX=521096 GN=Tpau_3891 PE=4 SV=1 [Tsukamurella paurometabola]|uniref:Uncharacterized protein n=1 Tax=Tsukamurella paurometabola (strain ATCC 8368 / DSM 20162 / CCUG 35730 / CIP 100753 / JCM 10117 / KCTC 9821 / NBRC 16120 / NCIMB 702349 / NCTC 13040) TaxID=521096 RepID=D5UMJ0_TSUPD|nr:hypothetical protein [Tsukamurella paurometabola]ADG80464.1 hypothetical protein Tpau_3891 [Tsukamurella paurometabola DSM 20162]SUP39740.1 Uncharacterised protein [Tsukamurella paurometabola]